MGNFKRDSAGGKAAGQMCEGNGNRGGRNNSGANGDGGGSWNGVCGLSGRGDAGMNRDEALHAVTPGRYVDLTLDA